MINILARLFMFRLSLSYSVRLCHNYSRHCGIVWMTVARHCERSAAISTSVIASDQRERGNLNKCHCELCEAKRGNLNKCHCELCEAKRGNQKTIYQLMIASPSARKDRRLSLRGAPATRQSQQVSLRALRSKAWQSKDHISTYDCFAFGNDSVLAMTVARHCEER
jgi:hypothetical protein